MGLFSERLRLLRLKKGFTQQDFAQKIGVAKSTISQYEKGSREPNYETLEKIADFFGVSVDYLLGRTDISKDYKAPEPNTIAAHFDGDSFTKEELEEIRQFAEFVKNKRK